MTGAAPGDETGRTPIGIPAEASEVAGGHGRAQDGSLPHWSDLIVPGQPSPLDREGENIQVAYLHGNTVSHSWHTSMMNMVAYDKTVGLNVINSLPFEVHCSGPNSLVEGRNMAVAHFLDQTEADWLFFVDTDMGYQADAVERLLLAADAKTRPVVGGLCFAMKNMRPDGMGGFQVLPVPTLFMFAKNDKQGMGFANRFIYPPDTMVQVAGTGAAFLLIHRSILVALRDVYGDAWFDFVQYGDGVQVSEDLSFCWRLAEMAVPIFVHTGIKVSHHKELWLSESDYSMPDREPMAQMMAAANQPSPKAGV